MVLSVGFYRSDHAAVFVLSMDSDDDVLLDWEAYAGAPQHRPLYLPETCTPSLPSARRLPLGSSTIWSNRSSGEGASGCQVPVPGI